MLLCPGIPCGPEGDSTPALPPRNLVAFGQAAGGPRQSALSLAKSFDQTNQQSTEPNNNTKSTRIERALDVQAFGPGKSLLAEQVHPAIPAATNLSCGNASERTNAGAGCPSFLCVLAPL